MKANRESKQDKSCSQTPKNIKTDTQVAPEDFGKITVGFPIDDMVSEEEVEEAVTVINPDRNSMESRG